MAPLHLTIIITVVDVTTSNPGRTWTETGTMEELIAAYDPFNATLDTRGPEMCGVNRALSSIGPLFFQMAASDYEEWYTIHDEMVMSYWESHDDEQWWTPLCLGTRGWWSNR